MVRKISIRFLIILILAGCKPKNQNAQTPGNPFPEEYYDYPVPTENASIDEINNYATAQWGKGNYQEAMNYFSKAYKKAKQKNDETQIANILNNLGLVQDRKSVVEGTEG